MPPFPWLEVSGSEVVGVSSPGGSDYVFASLGSRVFLRKRREIRFFRSGFRPKTRQTGCSRMMSWCGCRAGDWVRRRYGSLGHCEPPHAQLGKVESRSSRLFFEGSGRRTHGITRLMALPFQVPPIRRQPRSDEGCQPRVRAALASFEERFSMVWLSLCPRGIAARARHGRF